MTSGSHLEDRNRPGRVDAPNQRRQMMSLSPPLVPEERLSPLEGELLRRLSEPGAHLWAEMVGSRSGEALGRALAFEKWPELIAGHHSLPPLDLFYNRYFWFRRFATLSQLERGPDAGLEQQGHDVLAEAPDDVDWDLVAQLEADAELVT